MTDEISELRAQLDQLQSKLTDLEKAERDEPSISRRRAFKTLGAAAAGAAVGGIAFANPAAATDGNSVVIGNQVQTTQSPTALITNGYSGAVNYAGFMVTDEATPSGGFDASLSAIAGVATGPDFTVGLFGSGSSVGAKLDGPTPLKLSDSSNAGAPSPSVGTEGMFRFDNGDLYFCVSSAGSDRWRRVSGTAVAGAFTAITPARVYDSRWAGQGPLSNGQNRTVSIKDKKDAAGNIVTANVVPAGSRAITFNLTIFGTSGGGYLSMVPGDSSDFTTSTINWSATGQTLANGSTVKVDTARQVKVFCGGPGTQFLIDVTGYYL